MTLYMKMNKPKLNQPIDYLQELKRNVSVKGKLTLFQEICFEHIEKALNQPNPTLEEIKKEWEDDGFKFNKIFCYELINTKDNTKIYFDNDQRGIWCNINGHLSLKQLIRLTKTFRALGWRVEDEGYINKSN